MTITRNLGRFRLLSPLVFALLTPPAFAQSIIPGNSPPAGVTLSTLTLTPSSTDPNVFSTVQSPVYTQGGFFSPSATGPAYWGNLTGEFMPPQMNCLAGCTGDASLAGYTYLELNFQNPVLSVTATEYSNINNPSGLQAFDSSGNLIGFCAFTSSSCYTALWTQGSSGPPTTYVPGTFTVSGDISTVLITSFDFAPTSPRLQ